MSCTFEDETKTVVFKPKNLSAQARAGSAIGVAILCPICGVGYAAATAGKKENDIHGFSSLTVEFD
ncbi:MAG: hypothetical protein OIF47_14195 [Marinibacterium sp.]|nr:hypothetical protein [Marinibacterium sp.]